VFLDDPLIAWPQAIGARARAPSSDPLRTIPDNAAGVELVPQDSKAKTLGWLHVELVRAYSGNKKHVSFRNNYQACVPDYLELADVDEELRDVLLSQSGDIDEGGDTGSRTWGHPEQEVGTNGSKVGTQLWPKNSSVLNSSVLTPQGEGALARPTVDKSTERRRQTKNEEPTHISTVLADRGASRKEVCKAEVKQAVVVDVEANRTATLAELRKKMAS